MEKVLKKEVCIACVNKNRTVFIKGENKVANSPWTSADDGLWENGIIVCYNNISSKLNEIPIWCPDDEVHRLLSKKTPNTLENQVFVAKPINTPVRQKPVVKQRKTTEMGEDDLSEIISEL